MRLRSVIDTLAATGTLATTGARLAWHGRRPGTLPRSVDEVSATWLSDLLRHRHPGAVIEGVEPRGWDTGTTTRTRLRITHTGPRSLPPTLFLKLAPPDLATRTFVDAMGLAEQEVQFYDRLAERLPIPVPRAWATAWEPTSGRFALVLDDLVSAGCTLRSAGDTPCTVDETEGMIDTLAALHASSWNAPAPPWLRTPTRHRSLALERALTRLVVGRALTRHGDWLAPAVRAAGATILAARDHLERAWAGPPLATIHGDAHLGNTFTSPDGEIGLFDWQVVQQGQGMRDVSYFLCNSVPTELRRTHEHALIARYRDALAAHGVSPPALPTLWEQHRRHALYAWISAAFTAGAARLQPPDVVRAGLTRASAAVLDLDSLAAVS